MKGYSQIINKCRNGDRSAQMKFYSLFCNKVYNSSLRILNDRMQAEEVMQESILKVLMRTEMLSDDPGVMEAVLRRIAINHSIDLCRRNRLEVVEMSAGIEKKLTEEAKDDPPGITIDQIKEAIDRLPRGTRLIISLKLIEGYDNEEIASILDVSEAAVRSQYSRARKKLMEILKNKTPYEIGA
ncbi:MAG: sigma-70 family RNA polymerase sigma factor [Rikenellaceae bacterium]|nr:sigma-70 family RNA polymerase sigma factor [Rikenellaceae bacterium]